jgi:glycosyltransferase involved in cell wall biosynthesis
VRETGRPLHLGALFVSDWGHEFDDRRRGLVPRHRLFGIADLEDAGHVIEHLTRRDVTSDTGDTGATSATSATSHTRRLDWRLAQAWWVLKRQRHLDAVVATHEAAALPTLLLRRARLLRRPVLVMTVAATDPRHRHGLRGRLMRLALRSADLVTVFASSQVEPLTAWLGVPAGRVVWLSFGVDTEFFAPDPGAQTGTRNNVVLAVGTNAGKDYATLVRALPVGVTCTIVTDPDNERQAREHLPPHGTTDVRFRRDVPITELRDLYRTAGVVVLPLHESEFSSGQTVLLENLAVGTPVILSDVSGVRDYLTPSPGRLVPVRLVPPNDAAALGSAIADALASADDPALADARREHVLATFSGSTMAARLESLLRALL